MKANFISDYWNYSYSINEGNSYKKDLGIIGPFSDWGYKIKASCPGAGGETTDQNIIVSGLDEDADDLTLKYIYGDGKESDPVSFPKSSFDVSGSSHSPILQTRKNIRWWDSELNQRLDPSLSRPAACAPSAETATAASAEVPSQPE